MCISSAAPRHTFNLMRYTASNPEILRLVVFKLTTHFWSIFIRNNGAGRSYFIVIEKYNNNQKWQNKNTFWFSAFQYCQPPPNDIASD